MDHVSVEVRSRIMSRIPSSNTAPEQAVRSALHRRGLRFRPNQRDLPGKPDLVFAKYRTVVFVHGCFWHMHDCGRGKVPKSNVDFWRKKLEGNAERDVRNRAALEAEGWLVLAVWECEVKAGLQEAADRLAAEIRGHLGLINERRNHGN